MTSRVSLKEFGSADPSPIDLFVCSASFEERCVSIAKSLSGRIRQAVIVRNREFVSTSDQYFQTLQALFGGQAIEALVSSVSPMVTADVLAKEVVSRVTGRLANIFVDITTFTHEHLLILMALVKKHGLRGRFTFGYTGAAEYSTNTDEENVWLSRGVRQVRSILGYPGNLAPSKRLHLIVLMGFESERARLLIEIMEPSKISLGVGDPAKSVSQHHFARNERFLSRLGSFLETQTLIQTEITRFSFSCVDPFEARDVVLRESSRFSDFNSVVCPMNTKISTVGVGLAALASPRLQIVYASPEEYNEEGYSSPGDDVTTFEVAL